MANENTTTAAAKILINLLDCIVFSSLRYYV
jgi:hypothetical protein